MSTVDHPLPDVQPAVRQRSLLARMSGTTKRRRRPGRKLGKAVGIILVLLYSLFPAYWMISTAVDSSPNTRAARLIPESFTLEHFTTVLTSGGFTTFLQNSIIIAVSTVFIAAAVALFASIAVARFDFSLRKSMLIMILIVQMIPLEALVIPLFLQAKTLNLLNSYLGLVIVYLAFSLPFAVWTLRGFVAAVPKELEESAYIDGCSWWQMFWRILFPLVTPGLVSTSIFAFITAWNEFIFALTFMSDSSKYTVSVGLRTFFGQNTNDWGPIMAASTIITLPVLIFFMIIQSWLSSGLMSGATKG